MWPKLIPGEQFFLPSYGVMVALAFLSGIYVASRLGKKHGLDSEKLMNLALYCALAGVAGAKLAMFAFDWQIYWSDPSQLFTISTLQALGVYQGGLILAVVVAYWYMRREGLPFWKTADAFAPGIAIGHGIGRMGCFAAGCCWGAVCDRPWAVTFRNPDAAALTGVPLHIPLHPTQLYEAFAEALIFVVLWRLFQRPHREGTVLGWYLVLYSCVRFSVEFVRNHEQSLVWGLSLTQWISMATLAAGLWMLLRVKPAPRPQRAAA